MCGRFTLRSPADAVAELFELAQVPSLEPRYNICPTQDVAAVVMPREGTERVMQMLRWGLIPSWARDPAIGARMINARAETVASKPSFRSAFKRKRCLIVADGFYEWRKLERRKQPYYIHLSDKQPFAFAGLWERWEAPKGDAVDSCTIITTQPNELLMPLHDRMPVILPREAHDAWLDPDNCEVAALESLLRPYPAASMAAHPVDTKVNNPSFDSPECIRALA